jgi:hypothetical protein
MYSRENIATVKISIEWNSQRKGLYIQDTVSKIIDIIDNKTDIAIK